MTSICAASTLTCSCVASVFFLVSSCFCSSFSASDRFDFVCEKKVKGVRQRQARPSQYTLQRTGGDTQTKSWRVRCVVSAENEWRSVRAQMAVVGSDGQRRSSTRTWYSLFSSSGCSSFHCTSANFVLIGLITFDANRMPRLMAIKQQARLTNFFSRGQSSIT